MIVDIILWIALALSFLIGDSGAKIAVTIGFIMFYGSPNMYDLLIKFLIISCGG